MEGGGGMKYFLGIGPGQSGGWAVLGRIRQTTDDTDGTIAMIDSEPEKPYSSYVLSPIKAIRKQLPLM